MNSIFVVWQTPSQLSTRLSCANAASTISLSCRLLGMNSKARPFWGAELQATNLTRQKSIDLCSWPPHTFWPRCRRSLCKVCPYTLISNSRVSQVSFGVGILPLNPYGRIRAPSFCLYRLHWAIWPFTFQEQQRKEITNSAFLSRALLHRPGWAGLGQTWSLKSGQPENW